MVKLPIYLDCHATTPVDPRVLDEMLPFFSEHFGNAASRTHTFGWRAAEAVDTARRRVAALIGARSSELIFTSGATESNNLAIKGVVDQARDHGRHIITVVTEHRAVLDPCRRVERGGCRVTYLPVQTDGRLDLDELAQAIAPDTILITVMTANNEIGVLQPIAEIGALAKAHGVAFHTDAAQAVGQVPFDVDALNVDLVSLSAHKMYGPKGIGALYVRRRTPRARLGAMMDGGGHERGLRSGTVNVAGVVGFGKAAEICAAERDAEHARVGRLRDRLRCGLEQQVPDIRVNGSLEHRLANNLNVSVPGVDGATLLMGLDDIAVSSGSACTTATDEPSHVITALGVSGDLARASIRFGLGRDTTDDEIDYAVGKMASLVRRLRDASPLGDGVGRDEYDPVVASWLSDV